MPGLWEAGGEELPEDSGRVSLHHALVSEGIAYGSWRDGGLALVDVSNPTRPKLISQLNTRPPFGGSTHSTLPLPDRQLAIVAEEALQEHCADGTRYIWVIDVRAKSNPVTIATFPIPSDRDYCSEPGQFGPHNLHENRPGSFTSSNLIFATYQNAGVRVFDVSNQFRPEEVAWYVPPLPAHMVDQAQARSTHFVDLFVDKEGIIYVTDFNGGLNVLEYTGS
jgi:hypothetical protein